MQILQLGGDDAESFGEIVGAGAEIYADLAAVDVLTREREDGVCKPALLANGLEEPRRRQSAEDRVQHAGGVASLVVPRDAEAADADVDLLGVLGLEAHARRGLS